MTNYLSKIDDNVLYFDTETREGDRDFDGNEINAPIKAGAYKYTKFAEGCIMVTYAFGDGPVQVWQDGGYILDWCHAPHDLASAMVNPDVQVRSHNVLFDRRVLNNIFGVKIALDRFYCTMVKAYTCGLPGSLANLGAALDLPPELLKKAGWQLMKLFCTPNPDPWIFFEKADKWQEFIDYAVQDVIAMRECDKRMPELNYQKIYPVFLLDQKMNDRGVPVDTDFAHCVIAECDKEKDRINEEVKLLTDGHVSKVTQNKVMLEHLQDIGVDIESLTKDSVSKALEDAQATDNPYVVQLLLARQKLSKSSVSKYNALLLSETDGVIRDTTQVYGAHTGRYAGRNMQIQNLPRPELEQDEIEQAIIDFKAGVASDKYVSPTTTAASCIRASIAAPDGYTFVIRDFSSIEGMGLAWLAGEEWKLEAYRQGLDVYLLTHCRDIGVPYDPDHPDAKLWRKIGKVKELALGYQGWIGAWAQWADAYELEATDNDKEMILGWRGNNSNIVNFWSAMDQTFKDVCIDRQTRRVGQLIIGRPLEDYQVIQMPSGRFMMYYKPEVIETDRGPQFSYMGTNSRTRKWERLTSYGGKEVENATQCLAADILMDTMIRCEEAKIDLRMTVHDELVALCHEEEAEVVNEVMTEIMSTPAEWAYGLPLASTGEISRVYKK